MWCRRAAPTRRLRDRKDGCAISVILPLRSAPSRSSSLLRPTDRGPRPRLLRPGGRAPPSLTLSGMGVRPALASAPASLDFGLIEIATRSQPRWLPSGTRHRPSHDLRVGFTGANAPDFQKEDRQLCRPDREPGGNLHGRRGLRPGSRGTKDASLTVDSECSREPDPGHRHGHRSENVPPRAGNRAVGAVEEGKQLAMPELLHTTKSTFRIAKL